MHWPAAICLRPGLKPDPLRVTVWPSFRGVALTSRDGAAKLGDALKMATTNSASAAADALASAVVVLMISPWSSKLAQGIFGVGMSNGSMTVVRPAATPVVRTA